MDDADEVVAVVRANHEHLAPWMGWVHPEYGHDDFDRWRSVDHSSLAFIVDGRFSGTIGFNRSDPQNRSTAIGYWLAADVQGRGIVTTAVRELTRYGFDVLELHRVELRAAPDNTRSRAVAERCGFTYEGLAREAEYVGGRFRDLCVYGLLATD